MLPPQPEKMMLSLGKFYQRICKIPGIGEPMARSFARFMGRMIFYAPGSGTRREDSIQGVKKYLLETGEKMKFPFEMLPECDQPDSFEFYVSYCPYGFKTPEHARACDAAMDMDRVLFGLIGCDQTIKESVVKGAPKCRMHMKLKAGAKAKGAS